MALCVGFFSSFFGFNSLRQFAMNVYQNTVFASSNLAEQWHEWGAGENQTERKHGKACDESLACSQCSGHTQHTETLSASRRAKPTSACVISCLGHWAFFSQAIRFPTSVVFFSFTSLRARWAEACLPSPQPLLNHPATAATTSLARGLKHSSAPETLKKKKKTDSL